MKAYNLGDEVVEEVEDHRTVEDLDHLEAEI